jgi:hypothetical protein
MAVLPLDGTPGFGIGPTTEGIASGASLGRCIDCYTVDDSADWAEYQAAEGDGETKSLHWRNTVLPNRA